MGASRIYQGDYCRQHRAKLNAKRIVRKNGYRTIANKKSKILEAELYEHFTFYIHIFDISNNAINIYCF